MKRRKGKAWCRPSPLQRLFIACKHLYTHVAMKEDKHACREERSTQRNADITLWDDIRNAYMNELGDITGVDEI